MNDNGKNMNTFFWRVWLRRVRSFGVRGKKMPEDKNYCDLWRADDEDKQEIFVFFTSCRE